MSPRAKLLVFLALAFSCWALVILFGWLAPLIVGAGIGLTIRFVTAAADAIHRRREGSRK